jgi:hypothetical protein
MKIFQVLNGICHWDATKVHPTLADTVGKYAPDIVFVEAPDYVFEGWGYLGGEFVQPTPPEGWLYDAGTGTFYPENGEVLTSDVQPGYEELKSALCELIGSFANKTELEQRLSAVKRAAAKGEAM